MALAKKRKEKKKKGVDLEEKSPDNLEEWSSLNWDELKLGEKPGRCDKIKSNYRHVGYEIPIWNLHKDINQGIGRESGLRGEIWPEAMNLGVTFFSGFKGQFKRTFSVNPLWSSPSCTNFSIPGFYTFSIFPWVSISASLYLIELTYVLDCRLSEGKDYGTFLCVFSQCLALYISVFEIQYVTLA